MQCPLEGPLLPVYATKIRAQAEPETFPEGPEGAQRIFDEGAEGEEGGYKALYRSLDTTILGYGLYGFFSFGGTELFERLFRSGSAPTLQHNTQCPYFWRRALVHPSSPRLRTLHSRHCVSASSRPARIVAL